MGRWKTFRWVAIAALGLIGLPQVPDAGTGTKSLKNISGGAPDPKDSAPAQYLGSEVCKTCHEDIYDNWEKTPHWKTTLDTKGGPSHQGCESCHGPGIGARGGRRRHHEDFRLRETLRQGNQRSLPDLPCRRHRAHERANSIHAKNDVSCTSCHSPHHATTKEFLLVKAQPELCYGCHLAKKAEFEMPFHHRVNEGLIQCTDCHNPHGTEGPKQVRMAATQDAGLLQVPHRQARSVRIRARAGKGGWLPVLPHGPRRAEPSHAEGQQRQSALPAVPHDVEFQRRAGRAVVPQPGELLPGMHAVPRRDSRLELQFDVFQVEAAMNTLRPALARNAIGSGICQPWHAVSGRGERGHEPSPDDSLGQSDGIRGSVAVGARGVRAGRHGRRQGRGFRRLQHSAVGRIRIPGQRVNGNHDTYDTFVNLGSGVRLFDYTLDMRSLNHQGLLFDNLHFSNFGYGGDPNDVSRLHIDKNKWYDFNVLFRRDKNFWDYNLFVNPLNPAAPNPVGSETTGCIVSGPTTAHPGLPGYCSNPVDRAEQLAALDGSCAPHAGLRSDAVPAIARALSPGLFARPRPGARLLHDRQRNDARLPRNLQLYDECVSRGRGFSHPAAHHDFLRPVPDAISSRTTWSPKIPRPRRSNTAISWRTARRSILGIVWSTQTPAEALPCAAPITNAATTPPTVNPTCNGFVSYSQVGRPRNYMPTERFRFQSNYFQKFEMEGSIGYSSSDNQIPDFNEILIGWTTRTAIPGEHNGRPRGREARLGGRAIGPASMRSPTNSASRIRSTTTTGAFPASGTASRFSVRHHRSRSGLGAPVGFFVARQLQRSPTITAVPRARQTTPGRLSAARGFWCDVPTTAIFPEAGS